MKTIYLIGGPADLTKQVIYSRDFPERWAVATLPEVSMAWAIDRLRSNPLETMNCRVSYYRLDSVHRDFAIYIYDEVASHPLVPKVRYFDKDL